MNGFGEKFAFFCYTVKMKPPKCPKTRSLIERLNIYLRDNPTCKLVDAGKLLGIKDTRIRKWKQFGWIEHQTPFEARQATKEQTPPLLAATQALATQQPSPRRKPSVGVVAPSSGAVAVTGDYQPDSLDSLIARGKDLKISEIRALVKSHLVAQVGDAKAVSNYAAGLKALSGVQDVELEDIYETENMIRIYVPAEDALPVDVLEVDPIEY